MGIQSGKSLIEVSNSGRMTSRLLDHDLFDIKLTDKACKL